MPADPTTKTPSLMHNIQNLKTPLSRGLVARRA